MGISFCGVEDCEGFLVCEYGFVETAECGVDVADAYVDCGDLCVVTVGDHGHAG